MTTREAEYLVDFLINRTAVVETERIDSPFYEPAVAQQQALRHLLVCLLADEEQPEKKPL